PAATCLKSAWIAMDGAILLGLPTLMALRWGKASAKSGMLSAQTAGIGLVARMRSQPSASSRTMSLGKAAERLMHCATSAKNSVTPLHDGLVPGIVTRAVQRRCG